MKVRMLDKNVILMICIAFLANMCGSMILPLFPIYIKQFHFSTFMMSLLFSLFYVGRACGGVLAGKLYEVLGAKRTGILLLLLETMLMAGFVLGTSFLALGILRILQGLVSTGLTVFVRTSINEMSTEANRGIYNGYISSSEEAGMFLGPAISGAVATIALSFLPCRGLLRDRLGCFYMDIVFVKSSGHHGGDSPFVHTKIQTYLEADSYVFHCSFS